PGGAAAAEVLRPWRADIPEATQPLHHRLRALLRGRGGAVRRQSVADRAGGGAGSVRLSGPGAGGNAGAQCLSAHRRFAVFPDAARSWLLLADAERTG